jgi:SSS family solute:Na+ symporter
MLEKFYGKPAARISSLIIPIAWTGVVAAQIIGASKILDGLGFFSYQTGAIFSGVVFIVYTLLGGQVSILKTDLFQAFLIISGVLLIFAFAYTGTDRVGSNHSDPIMLFNEKFGFFDLFILVFTYSVTFLVGPDIYSRLFCAKNEHTARITVLTVAVLLIPMAFMLTFLGRYSHQINDENIMAFAQHLLPDWGFALFIAALLSAVMSSADTTLLTSAIILSGLVNDDLDRRESTRMTHLFVLLIGIISIVIALKINSIIGSLLFALSFFSGAFVVPVLSGLLNIKVNREKVVAAILAGGLTALAGKITATFIHPLTGNLMIIFSFVINALILFIGNSKKSY